MCVLRQNYEVRNYGESTWVTTSDSTIEAPSADTKQTKKSRNMFFKLFDYISGQNEKSMQQFAQSLPKAFTVFCHACIHCRYLTRCLVELHIRHLTIKAITTGDNTKAEWALLLHYMYVHIE